MSGIRRFHKELDNKVRSKIVKMRRENPCCFDKIIVIDILRYVSCIIDSQKEVITQCCKNNGNIRAVDEFFNYITRHFEFALELLKGLDGTGHRNIAEDIMSDINIDTTALDIETYKFIRDLKYAQAATYSANPPPYDMESVDIPHHERKIDLYSFRNQGNSPSENSTSLPSYDDVVSIITAGQERELQRYSTSDPVSQTQRNNLSLGNNTLNIHLSSGYNNLLETDVTMTSNSRNCLTDEHTISGSSGDNKLLDTEVTDETVTSDSRDCFTDKHVKPGSSGDSKLLDTEVTEPTINISEDCSANERPFNISNSDTVCTLSVMHESELSMSDSELSMSDSDGEEFNDTLPKVLFATDDNQLSQISKKGSDFTESQECETILEKKKFFEETVSADNKTASTEKKVANTPASSSEKPEAVAGSLENVSQGWAFAVASIAVLFLIMKWHLK